MRQKLFDPVAVARLIFSNMKTQDFNGLLHQLFTPGTDFFVLSSKIPLIVDLIFMENGRFFKAK